MQLKFNLTCNACACPYYNSFCWFCFNNTFGFSSSTMITFGNDAKRLGWAIRAVKASECNKRKQYKVR